MADLFECAQFVKQAYPDDLRQWPEAHQQLAFLARDRLLARQPGLLVISERSYCIDSTDERWPADLPVPVTHALMYEVKLNASIEVGEDG